MIKSSFYNVLVPIEETEEFMIYNTKNGGIEVLNGSDADELVKLIPNESIDVDETGNFRPMLEYLYAKGYFINSEINEKEEFHEIYKKQRQSTITADVSNINLTVGTTITCNMGCPYCFEFVKPNLSLKNEKNIRDIAIYLEDMIKKSPIKNWASLNVTWYGGEPLINTFGIGRLTPLLLNLCEKYGMNYNSDIITNGLLLNKENWAFLVENKVQNAQVTIDGAKVTHNKSRPLKGIDKDGRQNYEKILENLSIMPEGIKTTIRVNVDKKVAATFGQFFEDMESFGIWPIRFRDFTFSPSWLRVYDEAEDYDAQDGLTNEDFFDTLQDFRKLKLRLFNTYAEKNNLSKAKLKWSIPSKQQDCATWVSPYSMVVDPEGYLHKCWETIHDNKKSTSHVSTGYNFDDFKKYFDYDRFELNDECSSCQYLPVCDQLSCSHQALEQGKPPCTYWKEKTVPFLKEQYLTMVNTPELIGVPFNQIGENSGHSNK